MTEGGSWVLTILGSQTQEHRHGEKKHSELWSSESSGHKATVPLPPRGLEEVWMALGCPGQEALQLGEEVQ